MNGLARLRTGMAVVDISSYLVGHVGSVHEHGFTVEIPNNDPVILNEAALFSVDEYVATLICVRDRIDRYAA